MNPNYSDTLKKRLPENLLNKMCRLLKKTFPFLIIFFSQNFYNSYGQLPGEIHGNFQADAQYYNPDTAIGAPPVPEKALSNSFLNLIYTNGKFTGGLRFESYLNAMQGFDKRYQGTGIPYRFLNYKTEEIDITAGSFYEQFGTGMLLRTYEERNLGYDNALDGFRIKAKPLKGIYLKGLWGRQRFFFDYGPGIVRGLDAEIVLNELLNPLEDSKTTIIIGGSGVSKYQSDQDPTYRLPENVGGGAARLNLIRGRINFLAEYAYKINDPSTGNNFIYKPGEGLIVTIGYSKKGLGISGGFKRIDNMNFRSDRTATGNNLMINYLPPLTRQHVYSLAGTIYPYASQPNGEMSYQGEVLYKLKKETLAGGKYGTDVLVNFSMVNSIVKKNLNDLTTSRKGYSSQFFSFGDESYFRDFNIELSRKFSPKLKGVFSYLNLVYNKDVVQGLDGYGTVYADIGIVDLTWTIKPGVALRTELQGLRTKQDMGSWAMGLSELTISPHWFVAVLDQYNFGNDDAKKRIHYFTGSVGYTKKTHRIALGYGKQRAGIFCVGGVCRNIPASNGLSLSITSSF